MARGIKEIIKSKPDLKTNEYVAIIWKDSHGGIKSTSLERGSDRSPPINNVWGQVDFAGGGLIVAIVHSHPTMYNAGSLDHPDWQPRAQGGTLSSIDFDQLIDYSKGRDGFDSPNYRSYLVYEGNLNEYHAFDQNKAFLWFRRSGYLGGKKRLSGTGCQGQISMIKLTGRGLAFTLFMSLGPAHAQSRSVPDPPRFVEIMGPTYQGGSTSAVCGRRMVSVSWTTTPHGTYLQYFTVSDSKLSGDNLAMIEKYFSMFRDGLFLRIECDRGAVLLSIIDRFMTGGEMGKQIQIAYVGGKIIELRKWNM